MVNHRPVIHLEANLVVRPISVTNLINSVVKSFRGKPMSELFTTKRNTFH